MFGNFCKSSKCSGDNDDDKDESGKEMSPLLIEHVKIVINKTR